ncbi:urease accessory protein UreF [Pseudogulbenkiania subflava]|uniref:Urease accessory protein UreF n=1 Tax=Pseudogulbenkiania subflava DSM 22618 TaxID=1123014 RepID=A0A1Y6BXU8_9NEIS|nr:urease accessory UreF family protein [Pseudogulbenkiania subflava]SMF33072.1 urease accessory protein [Pseudogulbenkiania subflava DSM 22618]
MNGGLVLLQLLRLASPGLPIGAYSYSQGLESALDLGLVTDAESARCWLYDVLHGPLSCFEAALLAQACRALVAGDEARLVAINQRLLASRDSRELRQETEQMGYSLRQLLATLPESQSRPWPSILADAPVAVPVAWAVAARTLGLAEDPAVSGYLWGWLENQIMVLLKAMPMGQTAGQQLLSALLPELAVAVKTACELTDDELSNFAPGLAWVAMKHETQYSRLFRS